MPEPNFDYENRKIESPKTGREPREKRPSRARRRMPLFQSYMPTDTSGAPIEHNPVLRTVLRVFAGIIAIAFALLMAVIFSQLALS